MNTLGRWELKGLTEDMEEVSVETGFTSLGSFVLKKVDTDQETDRPNDSAGQQSYKINNYDIIDTALVKESLWSRPWILYDHCNCDSEEFKSEQPVQGTGQDSEADVLEEAPIFYPTEEEFVDTLSYIEKICPKAEPYGICRIVPPASWMPPCILRETKDIWEKTLFFTQTKRIGRHQNHSGQNPIPKFREDGDANRTKRNRLESGVTGETASDDGIRCSSIEHIEAMPGLEYTLEKFKEYADDFKKNYFSTKPEASSRAIPSMSSNKSSAPLVTDVEHDYWLLAENSGTEIEVLNGDNPETEVLGSGFPSVPDSCNNSDSPRYMESGWNLTNMSRLSGSLLRSEDCKSKDFLAPRLHIGMCFSSLSWRVEKHRLYALCYMHLGSPTVWYGVPVHQISKFEAAMGKSFPELSGEKHDTFRNSVMTLSPFALKAKGVPVYRCIQGPGEFVLVFPGLCYSAIDCGFNCIETVNFAPLNWLPHGRTAVELYRERRIPTPISHDKLILRAAKEAVKAAWNSSLLRKQMAEAINWKGACGKDGALTKEIKALVAQERNVRDYLWNSSKAQRMDKSFDVVNKRECFFCFWDLYLSAICCSCSPDRYSCPIHAKGLCTCPWSERTFLFRYTVDELNLLVEALEGKLSAVYKWGRQDLNFSLHSSVSSTENELAQNEDKSQRSVTNGGRKYGSIASIRAEVKARVQAKEPKGKGQETTDASKGKEEEETSKDREEETSKDREEETSKDREEDTSKGKEQERAMLAVYTDKKVDESFSWPEITLDDVASAENGSSGSSSSESDFGGMIEYRSGVFILKRSALLALRGEASSEKKEVRVGSNVSPGSTPSNDSASQSPTKRKRL